MTVYYPAHSSSFHHSTQPVLLSTSTSTPKSRISAFHESLYPSHHLIADSPRLNHHCAHDVLLHTTGSLAAEPGAGAFRFGGNVVGLDHGWSWDRQRNGTSRQLSFVALVNIIFGKHCSQGPHHALRFGDTTRGAIIDLRLLSLKNRWAFQETAPPRILFFYHYSPPSINFPSRVRHSGALVGPLLNREWGSKPACVHHPQSSASTILEATMGPQPSFPTDHITYPRARTANVTQARVKRTDTPWRGHMRGSPRSVLGRESVPCLA